MTKCLCQLVIFAAFLLILTGGIVDAQSIEQSVIAGGGRTSSDTNSTYSVTGTVGQPVTEPSSGALYAIKSGFFTASHSVRPRRPSRCAAK